MSETLLKAIEVLGSIDDKNQLHLDSPLPAARPGRVRVIILMPEQNDVTEEAWLRAAAKHPSFGFLREKAEDIYTRDDGTPFSDQE